MTLYPHSQCSFNGNRARFNFFSERLCSNSTFNLLDISTQKDKVGQGNIFYNCKTAKARKARKYFNY